MVQLSTPWGDPYPGNEPPVRRFLSNYFDLLFCLIVRIYICNKPSVSNYVPTNNCSRSLKVIADVANRKAWFEFLLVMQSSSDVNRIRDITMHRCRIATFRTPSTQSQGENPANILAIYCHSRLRSL